MPSKSRAASLAAGITMFVALCYLSVRLPGSDLPTVDGGEHRVNEVSSGSAEAEPESRLPRLDPDALQIIARHGTTDELRVLTDPDHVRALVKQFAQAELVRSTPSRPPDWELVFFESQRARECVIAGYWQPEGVVAEEIRKGRFHMTGLSVGGELPATMGPSIQPVDVPEPIRSHTLPIGSLATPRIAVLAVHCGRIFRGRVIGIADCFYQHPAGPHSQVTSYLVEVNENLKGEGPRYVRLLWPGGYLGKGEIRSVGMLSVGQEYLMFTKDGYRHQFDESGRFFFEYRGELSIASQPWVDWTGVGLMRIRDGRVVPAFDLIEQALAERAARGATTPVMNQHDRHPFPAWGLTWSDYKRFYWLNTPR